MLVKDIMTTNMVVMGPERTVMDAARLMQKHNIGSIPVTDPSGNIAGIITDRDIVVRCLTQNLNPTSTTVNSIMTVNVITCTPETDITSAVKTMSEKKIRRLPVMMAGKVAGIISLGDLATNVFINNEATQALSDISEPSRPMNITH